MAELPSIKRLVREDIPNAPEWIGQVIDPLNTFMEEVYYALDRDLTINQNIRGTIKTITLTTKSTYGNAPKTDNWDIQKITDPIGVKPEVVALGSVVNKDSFATITDPVYVSWDWYNSQIRINYIAGLAASTKYEIKLLIF